MTTSPAGDKLPNVNGLRDAKPRHSLGYRVQHRARTIVASVIAAMLVFSGTAAAATWLDVNGIIKDHSVEIIGQGSLDANTSIIDPNDADRHAAFWMDHRGECLQRGRIQPIEYADDTQATIGGERHPFQFDTEMDGLCVFQVPPQTAMIETDAPGTALRSPVRVLIPKVYLLPQFSSYWQPHASAPTADEN